MFKNGSLVKIVKIIDDDEEDYKNYLGKYGIVLDKDYDGTYNVQVYGESLLYFYPEELKLISFFTNDSREYCYICKTKLKSLKFNKDYILNYCPKCLMWVKNV